MPELAVIDAGVRDIFTFSISARPPIHAAGGGGPDTAVQHVLDELGLYLKSSTISMQSIALHLQSDPLISL